MRRKYILLGFLLLLAVSVNIPDVNVTGINITGLMVGIASQVINIFRQIVKQALITIANML